MLVINCGSSSIKYQLIDAAQERTLAKGRTERIGEGDGYRDALAGIVSEVSGHRIDAVGHRVVHGGRLCMAQLLDEGIIGKIEECIPLAPLHNPANLEGIRAARAAMPDLPHVAVFDTAYHSRMPRRASTYAIDPQLARRLRIRRYGFHGTSHAYVAGRAAEFLGMDMDRLRIVSCHLGNGASACAVEFGTSTETSMGMTPLEGLVMGTRCGDIDPGAVLALLRDGRTIEEVDHLLNQKSGLKGLSGAGADLRDIEIRAAGGDERARLAIAVFAHRVRKYIGAYAAAMGGVDAVVLTGGIGENSVSMRRRILQRLEFLGLILDHDRNEAAVVSHERPVAEISADHSRIRALVAATNEELMIARETAQVVLARQAECVPRPVPIAVHACHVHLSRETLKRLFGPGASLTPMRKASQAGQFVCREKVSIIGPRGRLDGVCVVGPLRSRTQVEIARSDEFWLGVDAPIRPSGRLEGSAPVTLEGPRGRVHLKEGMICAHRHIHMTPEDAELFCLRQGDEVEVKLSGGPRPLVFGEVLVRVRTDSALEMHLDIDEANAAGLPLPGEGEPSCRIPVGEVIRAEILRHTRRRAHFGGKERGHD